MSKSNDEHNFVNAYGESGLNFQKFDENTDQKDELQNSPFSLIRQIAKEQDDKDPVSSLLGSADGLKDHSSVMSLIKGEKSSPVNFKQDSVNIAHIAKPLRNRSSLISFLREDNDAAGLMARAPVDYLLETGNYSFSDAKSQSHYSDPQRNSVYENALQNDSSKNTSKGRYSSLFKSNSHLASSSNSEDSLQAIYKRLLKCQ